MAPAGSSHLNGGLAVLCAGGGAFGFYKARSVPSVRGLDLAVHNQHCSSIALGILCTC
jgi:hypothetical protein